MSRRPDKLPRTHRWRTNAIQVPLMAASTIICGSLSLLSSLFDRSGRGAAQDCAHMGEVAGVVHRLPADRARRRKPAQAPRGCVCGEPHLVHGYPGRLRRAGLPVSHSGHEEAVAGTHHRLVAEPVRPDSHRHDQSGRNPFQPGRRNQGLARGHATVYLSGGRAHHGRRIAAVSLWRSVFGDSRPGASRADCAERRV